MGNDRPLKDGTDRTNPGMVPKKIEHGMRLLGVPLKNIRTLQAHVVKLAMEEGTWAARCRLAHPGGTVGLPPRKRASHEYASELISTGRGLTPITR